VPNHQDQTEVVANPAAAHVQPATALPWKHTGTHYADCGGRFQEVVGHEGREVISECGPCAEDAAYLVHAANAYPRLIAAVKAMQQAAHLGESWDADDFRAVDALLRELRELS
jgi:hypothetical protein